MSAGHRLRWVGYRRRCFWENRGNRIVGWVRSTPEVAAEAPGSVHLGKIGWTIDRNKLPLVLEVLTRALGEDNELVCWVAADCLGQMGPEAREAIPALRQALRRPFKIGLIGKGVALALRRIDPQAASEAGVG
jgi:hypothetical protein